MNNSLESNNIQETNIPINFINNKFYFRYDHKKNGQQKKWIENNMQKINLEHISRLGFPILLQPGIATLDDIYIHMRLRQRLQESTAQSRIRSLERIANHPYVPMDLSNPTYENWVQHADYREQIEQAGPHAIINEWKAVKTLLTSYGIHHWDYRPPSIPTKTAKIIQHPDRIREMITSKFTGDYDHDRHIQYILLATYMIGLRNPSETCILKISDVDLDKGTILITEPKKLGNTREIAPETKYMTGKNCKSMKFWIDQIRDRYCTYESRDYLFISLTGKPFTSDYLRKYLSKTVKPLYPEYQPYLCRHWNATAKLIQEFIRNGHWNKNRVANWLGHENDSTTDNYIGQAETMLKIAPYDWFQRVLKRPNSKKSKIGGKHVENHRTPILGVCDLISKENQVTDLQGYLPFQQKENFVSKTWNNTFPQPLFLSFFIFSAYRATTVFIIVYHPLWLLVLSYSSWMGVVQNVNWKNNSIPIFLALNTHPPIIIRLLILLSPGIDFLPSLDNRKDSFQHPTLYVFFFYSWQPPFKIFIFLGLINYEIKGNQFGYRLPEKMIKCRLPDFCSYYLKETI